MSQHKNALLICATEDNQEQLLILLHSLRHYYTDRIIISCFAPLKEALKTTLENWEHEIFTFKSPTPEAGLVIKALAHLYDSSYLKVLYLHSSTLVNGDLTEMLTVDLGQAAIAARHEYDYLHLHHAQELYTKEHPQSEVIKREFVWRYFNFDVAIFNLHQIRRHMILDGLFDKFWHHQYRIELGLSEFCNGFFKDQQIAKMPSTFNAQPDRYLYAVRPYRDLIKDNQQMSQAAILNFSQIKPWKRVKLDRRTMSAPVWIYADIAQQISKHLPAKQLDIIKANGDKFTRLIGALPNILGGSK